MNENLHTHHSYTLMPWAMTMLESHPCSQGVCSSLDADLGNSLSVVHVVLIIIIAVGYTSCSFDKRSTASRISMAALPSKDREQRFLPISVKSRCVMYCYVMTDSDLIWSLTMSFHYVTSKDAIKKTISILS